MSTRSIQEIRKEEKEKAITIHQKQLLYACIWRSCLNCENWSGSICKLVNKTPPPDIIVHGCEEHVFEIPF